MAAGLGFKNFSSGEVLTAADVNGYLMQGVGVFTDAANRDAEITSPQEGQFAYLKDTNVTTYYTGSAWANLDTTGMTNPMTTTGDTIYSSSGSTPARLGIGSTGQVLTVAAGIPSWATPAGAKNYSLLNAGGTALTGASTITVSGISGMDSIMVLVDGVKATNASEVIAFLFNGDTGNNYTTLGANFAYPTTYAAANLSRFGSFNGAKYFSMQTSTNTNSDGDGCMTITGANTAGIKIIQGVGAAEARTGNGARAYVTQGYYKGTSTISSVAINCGSNFTAGTMYVYGSA
jgi:hypothetical protein